MTKQEKLKEIADEIRKINDMTKQKKINEAADEMN